MKKFLALAAVMLGLASCQTEPEGFDVNVGGEQDVNITVSLPEGTRADSALGAFDNVNFDEYDVRFQCEVHYGTEKKVLPVQISDNGKEATFNVRLIANRNYTFVVWADLVKEDSTADLHYNTANGLANITLNDTWVAMDETRDAFTCSEVREFTRNANINLELTRPFAKLRVITTDMKELMGVMPTSVEVEYTTNHFNTYNALTKTPSGELRKEHVQTAIAAYNYQDGDAEKTLFTDYFFATDAQNVVNFNMNVYDQNSVIIDETKSFNTPIPAKRNYVTTIKGNILTYADDFTVEILPGFDGEEIVEYVDTASKLQELINEATDNVETTIVLGGNINLDDILSAGTLATRAAKDYALLIPTDKKVVLDLNGYTISQTKECTGNYAMIVNKGELTIAGEGKISFNDTGAGDPSFGWGTYTLRNEGKLVVNGGTIEHLGAQEAHMRCAIFQYSGSSVINSGVISTPYYRSARLWSGDMTINGGSFEGQLWLQAVDDTSDLTINGGTFAPRGNDGSSVFVTNSGKSVKFAVNGGHFTTKIGMSEPFGCITGGTFTTEAKEATNEALINENYTWVEAENGLWTLGLKPAVAKIGEEGYTSIQKAVAAAQNGDTVLFVADVEQEDGVIITDKNITIDLNDYTFTVSNGANTNNRNFKVNGSSVVTIKNGTMVAAGDYSSGAYGTVRTEGTANVTLEDVILYNYRGNGLNVKACTGTTVTITDTEVYSQYGGGIESAGGTIELTNVKVEQKGMYTAPYNSMAISVNGGGTVTVNSGTYSTECITAEEANNQGTSHGPWCAGVLNSGGTLIIKGGTFSNDNFGENTLAANARGLLLADTGANIQIEGGTFNAVKAIIDMTNNLGDASRNPSATISGGDFSADPQVSGLYASHLIKVAEGYVVDEIDGRYQVVKDVKVAKVGNTEYHNIDDAIAAWTNNTTLTLISDVTLNDVITLNSTEHHILDLATYTLTAASGKNAIEITPKGAGTAARSCLTINADASDPGCIEAGSKACIYYKKTDGSNDRLMVTINGGIYNGTISSSSNNGGQACPYFVFNGGVFNKSINLTKAMLKVTGGIFHGMFSCTGDSTAHRLISGGTFKSFTFMTADAANKFCIGTDKQTYNVGLYINDEGYLVVGGPVITEFGDKFAAKATNATKWNSCLQYSSAAANGLYYTNAEMAIAKHGEANVELK